MTQLIGGRAVKKKQKTPWSPYPQSHSTSVSSVVKEIEFLVIMNLNEKIFKA